MHNHSHLLHFVMVCIGINFRESFCFVILSLFFDNWPFLNFIKIYTLRLYIQILQSCSALNQIFFSILTLNINFSKKIFIRYNIISFNLENHHQFQNLLLEIWQHQNRHQYHLHNHQIHHRNLHSHHKQDTKELLLQLVQL